MTEEEYDQLNSLQIETVHPDAKTLSTEGKKRIICNCLARDQSIQILAAVDVDLWTNIAFIKIEGLVSMDEAIQIAVPTTIDVFRLVLETQDKRIATSRAKDKPV